MSNCSTWVWRNSPPNMAKVPKLSLAAAMENLRLENSPRSSIGWRLWDSQAMKTMRTARAPEPAPITSPEVQPLVGASMIAHSSRPRPTIEHSEPPGSGLFAARFFELGTRAMPSTKATAAIGTLTRNIEPHQKWASSRPPAIGPSAIPTPITPPQAPMARARRAGSRKTSLMIDSDDGIVDAAPAPMTPLHAISSGTEPEKAAPTEPPANTVRPRRKNHLRPIRSARLPFTSNNPAKTMA